MRSKQAKAREFSTKDRQEIYIRDKGSCIFCEAGYHMPPDGDYGAVIKGIMHYIPRSRNGLGIPQNGAIGCQYHHEMMDNGNTGRRTEMLKMLKDYLKRKYPEWDEAKLIYSKWR